RVDLEEPELTLWVEVLRDRILYSFERLPGPGGFPVGSSGRVLALLSGGIDSPVAAWRMMKRGCRVVLAPFHAFPLQDRSTLDNMVVIGEATRATVLRPLVGMDKEEITTQARRIGTFEVSTRPDQDCCQLFVPRHPATAASREEVERAETALDVPALVAAALEGVAEERFEFPPPAASPR